MSVGLETIHEELRRLQKEGVETVFVDDATLSLLTTNSAPNPQAAPEPSPQRPVVQAKSELKDLVQAAETPKKSPPAKPTKATTSQIKPLPAEPPSVDLPQGSAQEQMTWLQEKVQNCPTCNEHLSPTGKVVFGTGSVNADIFFCGEAPGADEETQGVPFVGKAGQLLDKIITAMGLKREEVYIANILKWRPEHDKPYGNRPPTFEEMNFCLPYVKAQIAIVRPKVIVALGNTAVTGLLGPDPNRRMGSIRGTWHEFAATPLMITFHPSYLLRNDTLKTKRMVWEDLLKVMEKVELPISEKQRGFFLQKG